MKKLLLLAGVVFLAGCAPYKVNVYGKTGQAFTAPSLCAALVQCLNSNETACYYDRTLIHDASGTTDESGCKEIKK